MRFTPVQLRGHRILDVGATCNSEYQPQGDAPEDYRISVRFGISNNPDEEASELSVSLALVLEKVNNKCAFDRVNAIVQGAFDVFGEPPPPEAIPKLLGDYVLPSCVNVLYGLLRGYLSSVTSLFPGGPINVPSIDPTSVVEDAVKERQNDDEALRQEGASGADT